MNRILFLVFSLFMLGACTSRQPSNVLPFDTLKKIKWDLMQADEMVDYYKVLDTTYPEALRRRELYAQAFSAHKVSRDQVNTSLDYYSAHPELMKKLIDSLQQMGERLLSDREDAAPTDLSPVDTNRIHPLKADSLMPFRMFKRKRN